MNNALPHSPWVSNMMKFRSRDLFFCMTADALCSSTCNNIHHYAPFIFHSQCSLNTLRPRQNGHADDTFKHVFLNEHVRISIKISLKFVPKGPNKNIPVLVQIMAWHNQVTSHYLNQCWLGYWHIYVSLSLNELILNLLDPGGCGFNLKCVMFKCIVVISFISISSAIAFRSMAQDPTDEKSKLVQVMAWCHQATSHYLNQCWLRFVAPYGVTRPQWVRWLQYFS